jgi:hypothetical protein
VHQPATIRSYRLLSAVAAGLLFAVGACAPDVPSPTPATIASAAPTASPVASFEPADLERWIAFRQAYGLRSDLAWVMQVARDPANANEMKVPLLPGEINAVAAKNRAIQDVMPAVIAYGQGFADYGGARIEGTKGIVLFGSEVEAHQATLDRLFGPGRITVLQAPYSIAELEALGETVMAERHWFRSLGVELIDANPYELTNQVRVRYISPDTSPEAAILAHFEHPDWMTLRWIGPP